jgi:hypothetical protein
MAKTTTGDTDTADLLDWHVKLPVASSAFSACHAARAPGTWRLPLGKGDPQMRRGRSERRQVVRASERPKPVRILDVQLRSCTPVSKWVEAGWMEAGWIDIAPVSGHNAPNRLKQVTVQSWLRRAVNSCKLQPPP